MPGTKSRTPLKWVALGDSYSADVGVPRWDPGDGCGRSGNDWEQQLASRLNAAPPGRVRLDDVTCGAAEIGPGVLAPQPCELLLGPPYNRGTRAQNGEGRPWLEAKFAALTRDYTAMMSQIHQRAPHAKVFLLGYPTIVSRPYNPLTCYWGNFKRLGTIRLDADGDFLTGLEQRLNDVIRQQAQDNPGWATFVDTYQSSQGHGETKPADPAEYQCALMNDIPPLIPGARPARSSTPTSAAPPTRPTRHTPPSATRD